MNVLVTGSAGFVGRELVPRLRAAGHRVIGIDLERDDRSDVALVHDLRTEPPDVGAFDACIHLASAVGGILYNLREDEQDANERIDAQVLRLCERATCRRLVFFSSINVFEATPTFEHAPLASLDQVTPYARSKARGEHLFAAAIPDLTVIRPTNVFGASQRRRHATFGESHVIPDLLDKIRAGGEVVVLGDGSQVRNFVHVGDICSFVLGVLPLAGQHYFNLRSNITLTISQLVQELVAFMDADVSLRFDPSYMKHELFRIRDFDLTVPRRRGWAATVRSIADGLRA